MNMVLYHTLGGGNVSPLLTLHVLYTCIQYIHCTVYMYTVQCMYLYVVFIHGYNSLTTHTTYKNQQEVERDLQVWAWLSV